jgi:histidine ammonia-lyase
MTEHNLTLDESELTFQQVKQFLNESNPLVSLSASAEESIQKCRNYLDSKINDSDNLFYGINTGFGFLQNVRINKEELNLLQDNLIKSHACGMGDEVPKEVVKLMLMLKLKSLSYGHSGVGLELVKRLQDMFNHQVWPIVYTQGSLGASGDLAPLSHLCLPLIGLGEVRFKGERMSAAAANEKLNWQPIKLQSKEGLALINGTQFMSAYGLHNLITAERLIKWADKIAAISFDAFDGNKDCFNEHIHVVRPHKGQVKTAEKLRQLLEGSEIANQSKQQIQDPYSFRCIPQVHGATKDTFSFVQQTFLQEINSVTDNPNIFPDADLIVSGGNFHGQPLALGLDFLCIAMSELGNISERRTFQLLSGQRGLPLFLAKESGLNSGLMIPQYTAAGIASENKQLCTPASIDSIPSSNNQEDHVSMGANAATKCYRLLKNVEKILAIELLTSAQALEFKRPLHSSKKIEAIVQAFREKVSFNQSDRVLHDDMVNAVTFLGEYSIEE